MFKAVFDIAFLVFATVSACRRKRDEGNNSRMVNARDQCPQPPQGLQGRLDGLATRNRQRNEELETAKCRLANIRVAVWTRELGNRRLRDELLHIEAVNQQCNERVSEAEMEQAAIESQLEFLKAQVQTWAQMLAAKETSVASLQRENLALRSALSSGGPSLGTSDTS